MNPASAQNFRDIEVRAPVRIVDGSTGDAFFADLNPDRVDFITDRGVEVWIERPAANGRGNQTRFVDSDGAQVGPMHNNLVPAIVYARYHGWRDPSEPVSFNDAAIAEVRANTTFRGDKGTIRIPGETETIEVTS